MSNNDMMQNWMATMGMMSQMMAQFQQQGMRIKYKKSLNHFTEILHNFKNMLYEIYLAYL